MDELRDALASAMSENPGSTEPVEASQEVESQETGGGENIQSSKSAPIQYEIGGKTYKTWNEAKQWGDNVASLWGKQAKELGTLRQQMQEAKEAIEWHKQVRQHPELAEGIRKAYEAFNQKIAQGGSQAQAEKAAAQVTAQFDEKTQSAIDFLLDLQDKYGQEEAAEAMDKEEETLKRKFPKISDATMKDLRQYNIDHPEYPNLITAYRAMLDEIEDSRPAPTAKDTGVPGKMGARVENGPEKPNLKDPNKSKKNIRDILNEG